MKWSIQAEKCIAKHNFVTFAIHEKHIDKNVHR